LSDEALKMGIANSLFISHLRGAKPKIKKHICDTISNPTSAFFTCFRLTLFDLVGQVYFFSSSQRNGFKANYVATGHEETV